MALIIEQCQYIIRQDVGVELGSWRIWLILIITILYWVMMATIFRFMYMISLIPRKM